MRTQIERVLKRRHDHNLPTLVGSNATLEEIGGAYGSTVKSVLDGGKYKQVLFDQGDFRAELRARMESEMGYDDD